MKAETKVGIFAVLGLVLFGISVYMLGNFSLGGEYKVNVIFDDVTGLPKKSAVKINGVEVGKVRSIKMDGEAVLVEIGVKDGVQIYKDSSFKIIASSILGTKYLKIDQGSKSSGVIEAGATMRGVNDPPVEELINQTMGSINEFVQSVNNKGGFGEDLNATLANVRHLSNNLNELVVSLKPYLETSVHNMSEMSEDMKTLMARIDTIARQVEEGEGTLGALINDPEMKADAKASMADLKVTIADAKQFMGKMSKFRVFWEYDAYYNTDSESLVSGVGLKIYPSNDYLYYRVGLSNIGNEDDTIGSKDYVEKNKIDARLGFYNNYFDVSAGYIMGGGGIRAELKPFYGIDVLDRVSFLGQVTDPGRDRFINGRHFNKANVLYGVNFEINKYIEVGAGFMDALEVNQPYIRGVIRFQDKDIASFFGLATLAG
ncbi:phospholipid/cholesterol/gamma-HCH transport system substrate-binding protein [Elusimicrobium posterum]|uniref:MlaD family protein n=1 Tax=Elusimicrobium posterum TaxID=3116653 RepID=UPI003C761835